jgi:hypothetical protein
VTETLATATIEREGQSGPPTVGLSAVEVARLVREMRWSRDTTISIQPEGREERLMVAVDLTQAFLGLERPDGLFQFARRDAESGSSSLLIGGQETEIDVRYVFDPDSAASVVEEWLRTGDPSPMGMWERQ